MAKKFRDALAEAQGRSEFVIVVVADIRGFSAFSKQYESPDIAMYIKRFYVRLIDDYFPGANFYKPTGDGLLLTFPYSEKNLKAVASNVLLAAHKCLVEFPNICSGDPMINFPTPKNIGFGISRGTACCLFSRKEILDYSGHLLNLTSRLMDLARPGGIVIDGNFLLDVIPEQQRNGFEEQSVFLRSIAEAKPHPIFYLKDYVEIPSSALSPLHNENWETVQKNFTVSQLKKLAGSFSVMLDSRPKKGSKPKIMLTHPLMNNKKVMDGYVTQIAFNDFSYIDEAGEPLVILNIDKALDKIEQAGVPKSKNVYFKIQYIPE